MPLKSGFRHCALVASCLLLGGLSVPVHASPLGLSSLIDMTIKQHPAMGAADANIEAARAAVESANWQFYPTASMTVESAFADSDDTDYAGDEIVANLNLQQPIWNWGSLQAGVDIAETNLALETTRKRQQQWQLAQSVIDAYGTWLSAYWNMRAWEKGLDDHDALLEQVRKRVNQGVSAPIDLDLAEGRVASTQAEYLASKSTMKIAVQELQQLVNSEVLNGNLVKNVALPLVIEDIATNIASLHINPSVRAAEAEVSIAKHNLVQQQANVKPAIYLRAEHQINNFSNSAATPKTRVFVGMSGSTGAGLSMQSDMHGYEAAVRAKEAELKAVQTQVDQAVMTAQMQMESLSERITSMEKAMATTTSVSESYSRQFLAGRKNWQEVMNSAREKVQMQVQISDLKSAYVVATWRLGLLVKGLDWLIESETNKAVNDMQAEAAQ